MVDFSLTGDLRVTHSVDGVLGTLRSVSGESISLGQMTGSRHPLHCADPGAVPASQSPGRLLSADCSAWCTGTGKDTQLGRGRSRAEREVQGRYSDDLRAAEHPRPPLPWMGPNTRVPPIRLDGGPSSSEARHTGNYWHLQAPVV